LLLKNLKHVYIIGSLSTCPKPGVEKLNAEDIAWVSAATALVMLMTPALGFFYAGLVRKKNLVSTLVQCFTIFAVVSLVWALWGYTLAFGPSVNGLIGNLSLAGLNNIGISICRKNKVSLVISLHCLMVNPNLCTNCPLGVEHRWLATLIGRY